MDINCILKERNLPELLEQDEMKDRLLKYEYGYIPDTECTVSVSEPENIENRYLSGSVMHSVVKMTVKSEYGSHTFPINRVLHTDGKKRPFFVFLNFRANVPDMYYPTEEVADEGFDILTVCYKDVTSDDGDFSDGIAGVLLPNGQENADTCGKIALWAWAASRILDYAGAIETLDLTKAAVLGHSRLGKTALVAAMMDKRFVYSVSNCSGNSGAALSRGTTGEKISDIIKYFPHWFCKNYADFTLTNFAPMLDQHFLLASIAPRYVYVASASLDEWADPNSEFLACVAASEMYEKMGYTGFVHEDRLPKVADKFHDGRIGYHNLEGMHFLSRHSWKMIMEYISKHEGIEI